MNLHPILVAADFSDVTPSVIAAALQIAAGFQSRIVLLHVSEPEPDFIGFDPGPPSVRASVARDFRWEHQQLDRWKADVATTGIDCTALHVQGPIAQKILSVAAENKCGLIVLGSHGHGAVYNLLAGSVATAVLKDAASPVLVVPAGGRGPRVVEHPRSEDIP